MQIHITELDNIQILEKMGNPDNIPSAEVTPTNYWTEKDELAQEIKWLRERGKYEIR